MSVSEKTQIVDYNPDYKRGVLQLMSGVPYKKLIWSWQFEDNPYELLFEPIVIKHGNTIVGFNGAMGVELIYDRKNIDAIWSCDFYVHSDFRGKGLGKIVKDKQFNSNNVIMALGLSEVAAYVWKKKGCAPNDDICALRKYGKVNSPKKFIWALFQMLGYIKGLPMRVCGEACQFTIDTTLVKKTDVDNLWRRAGSSYKKIVARNYDYLHWRYEKHPLAKYQFIHVYRKNELVAIGIFRKYKSSAKFVDMVAHSSDTKARIALAIGWMELHPNSEVYNCVSTDTLLQKCLLAHGFYKTRDKQWFFVHSKIQHDAHPERDWFIMSGDSDGEFLDAAASGYEQAKQDANIRIEKITDTLVFRDLRQEWAELLQKSEVNQLFLSWQWQYTWWEMWAEALGLKLMLLKAFDGDELVGIAPLYIDKIRMRSGIKASRIQFIGNAWRREGTVRTEYLEFIASKGQSREVCAAFVEYISNKKGWDEFVICDLRKNTDTYRQVIKHQEGSRWYIDIAEQDQGMNISTLGKFKDYVEGLGRNTRLKLFNRRKYLDSLGKIKCVSASNDDVGQYLSILNAFHQKRWGKDCFTGRSLEFHKVLLNRLSDQQGYSLNCIKLDDKVISILYNLRMGNTLYNIQSGFDEGFDKKLSLGTLHMGYGIEDAFIDQRVINFDMLAGKGKSEFYKSKYKGNVVDFITLRVTRSRLLKLWYVANHVMPEKIKRIIHKIKNSLLDDHLI